MTHLSTAWFLEEFSGGKFFGKWGAVTVDGFEDKRESVGTKDVDLVNADVFGGGEVLGEKTSDRRARSSPGADRRRSALLYYRHTDGWIEARRVSVAGSQRASQSAYQQARDHRQSSQGAPLN